MNIEGIWAAEFFAFPSVNSATGSGIVVLQNGRVLGGDPTYYYSGSYSLSGNTLRGEVAVTHYQGQLNNIFGPVAKVKLIIDAQVSPEWIMGLGYDPNNTFVRMSVRMKRLEALS
jgi:hypothetical protein